MKYYKYIFILSFLLLGGKSLGQDYDLRKIIIKFRSGVLNTSILCYDCDIRDTTCKKQVLDERFSVKSGIIAVPEVEQTFHYFGGDYLKRITAANPCVDTVSIDRYGNEVPMDPFNYMTLHFNNDTNAKRCVDSLTALGIPHYFQLVSLNTYSYTTSDNQKSNDSSAVEITIIPQYWRNSIYMSIRSSHSVTETNVNNLKGIRVSSSYFGGASQLRAFEEYIDKSLTPGTYFYEVKTDFGLRREKFVIIGN